MALDARARSTTSSRNRERRGDAASSATRAKPSSGIGGILLLALAGAVLAPIVSRFRRGDDASGGKKTARGSRVKESSARANAPNVPRNKASNNKKNKARRAEKRAERERVEREEAERVKREAERAKKAKSNSVPKDKDVVGGEAGKTFTTTSHVKVSTWAHDIDARRASGM